MLISKFFYLLLINVFIVNITAADNNICDKNIISHGFTGRAAHIFDVMGKIRDYQGNDLTEAAMRLMLIELSGPPIASEKLDHQDLNGKNEGNDITKTVMHLMWTRLLGHQIGSEIFDQQGLNGKNTAYLITGDENEEHSLMRWLLDKAPTVLATRERFGIFQQQIKELLNSGSRSFASVPCGVMDDLLTLDFQGIKGTSLTGVDLDPESLTLARASAEQKKIICDFYKKDAFNLSDFYEKFDVLISNGLNIYVDNDDKVIDLYKEFFKSLRDGGTLITSFLTPPPLLGGNTWKNIDNSDVIVQSILFKLIIGVKWQNFRTKKDTIKQLMAAGFKSENIKVIYDSRGMFPTVMAKK